jgi:DNA-binding NarL/FixJ family response regulator
MGTRTPVFIYAADPLSAAGAKAKLIFEPTIELIGPIDVDRARVALVVADSIDGSVAKVAKAIQRDGVPRVVAVAAHFDETGVVQAVAAGVVGFLRRAEATSARLAELIHEADRAGNLLPEGLVKRAATVQFHPLTEPHDVVDASRLSKEDDGGVATATEVRLSAREAEILQLVAEGYDTTDVADQLSYSESTIKGVLAKVMTRLEARNRCHAVAIALRLGLI